MGQLIIFEGLDGSGKGTQTKLTAQRITKQEKALRQITYTDNSSATSARQARRRERLRGIELLRRGPLCQLQDRLGRVLP